MFQRAWHFLKLSKASRSYSIFNNPKYSSSYRSHWIKYPAKLYSLFDTKLEASTARSGKGSRGEDGLWSQAVDVGCGHGNSSQPLLKYVREVLAVDSSESQLELGMKIHAETKGLTFKLSQAGAFSSLLPPNSVDLITAHAALHWFDRPKFYQECYKLLRPGGLLAISCHEYHEHKNPQAQACLEKFLFEDLADFTGAPELEIWNSYHKYQAELAAVFPSVERDESIRLEQTMTVQEYKDYIGCWPCCAAYKLSRPTPPNLIDQYIDKLTSLTGSKDVLYSTLLYCLFCTKD